MECYEHGRLHNLAWARKKNRVKEDLKPFDLQGLDEK
jgi:hypothetical protein